MEKWERKKDEHRGGREHARKRRGRKGRKCKCKRRGKEIGGKCGYAVYGGKLGIRYIRDLHGFATG